MSTSVKRLLVMLAAGLVLGLALGACGDDNAAGQDGGTLADAAPVVECTPSVDQCASGQSCECCGSIGPSAICVCTTTCDTNNDCQDPNLPHCNTPGPGTPGICTTADYNCCWMCQ